MLTDARVLAGGTAAVTASRIETLLATIGIEIEVGIAMDAFLGPGGSVGADPLVV